MHIVTCGPIDPRYTVSTVEGEVVAHFVHESDAKLFTESPEMLLAIRTLKDLLEDLSQEMNQNYPLELVRSLRFLCDAAETEPAMDIYRAHISQARQLISQVSHGATDRDWRRAKGGRT